MNRPDGAVLHAFGQQLHRGLSDGVHGPPERAQGVICKARDLLNEPGTGRAFLLAIKALENQVLKDRDRKLPIVEHTANAFDVELEQWNSNYLGRMRFVVAPEGAEVRVRNPGRVVGTLAGGILGFLVGVLVALVLSWWRTNRAIIVAKDD